MVHVKMVNALLQNKKIVPCKLTTSEVYLSSCLVGFCRMT